MLREEGVTIGRFRVRRSMRELGLVSKQPDSHACKQATVERPDIPNRLNREFATEHPNQVWCGDITYVWAQGRWHYLAAVLDLHTRRVIGWGDAELGDSQAIENLLADLNESYNAKNKAWGFFQGESGAYPFSGWLGEYLEGDRDFVGFSREAVEHLQKLMEESNLSTGGHILFAHYQQGMTDYLAIALLHHSEGVAVNDWTTRAARWSAKAA